MKATVFLLVSILAFGSLGAQERFIQHNGFARAYLLYVPSSYDGSSPYPLIVVLHGAGGSDAALYASGFNERAEIMNFIAVYPGAVDRYWGGPDNDVDFISALIDTLEDGFNIDPKRIYATGHSAGAFLSYQLAVELPDRFAAIAPVAGYSTAADLTMPTPMPVCAIHAVDDPVVSYGADQAGLAAWRTKNQCQEEPDTVLNMDGLIGQAWTAKETGADVAFYTYARGGHTWLHFPVVCTDLIVDFFHRHPKRGANVTLTSPADMLFDAPAAVPLTVSVESDVPVTRVDYFVGSMNIGGTSSSPYSFTWTAALPGDYVLYAKAILADGTSAISNTKQIHVLLPNIAADQPCECSTAENGLNAAQYAFDGDFATRWSSSRSDPQWISVDLGDPRLIDGVTLFWGTSYATDYSVDVSPDNVNWTGVYATTAGNGGADYLSFSPVEGRYVRMSGNRRGTPYGYSLWEFQVHGENATAVKTTERPGKFALSRNYPNPFNASTSISFDLPTESWVSLKVYDLHGREAAVLVSEKMPAGNHVRRWDAGNFPGGVYCYRLRAGSLDQSGKLILLK